MRWCGQVVALMSKRMGGALSKFFFQKVGVFLAATFLLIACSPKLDWRTVQSPQEGYSALFPGKPEKIDRRFQYQDQDISQILEAVKIGDDVYSVGSIHLSKDQITLLPKLLDQLQSNLLKRAGVDLSTAISADATYQTAGRQRLSTKDYFFEFPSTGAIETSMRVRWITRISADNGAWIYQQSVLHSAPARVDAKKFFSEEAYSNFFDEFHPE